MAVTRVCGFEMGHLGEMVAAASPAAVVTSDVRSGSYALSSPTGSLGNVIFGSRAAAGTNRALFQSVRFYLKVGALPGASGGNQLVGLTSSLTTATIAIWALRLEQSGALGLRSPSGQLAISSNTLSADGQWHRIDVDAGWNAGAGVRVFVDGNQWASDSTHVISAQIGGFVGPISGATAHAFFFDDVVWHDSALPATLGDYNVNLLLPTADSAIGGWRTDTGGAGGSTNLYEAVNNQPPVGNNTTNATATTQISNAVSSTTDNFDATCAAYNTITGLTASSQVLAVQAVCNDAQEITTGSPKAGAVVIASNPTGQTELSFDFGLPNGTSGSTSAAAVGVFPAGWGTHVGPVTEAPSVNVSSGPVARVGKRVAATRVVDVDFLGVYVMSEAAAAPSGRPRWADLQARRRPARSRPQRQRGMAV